MVFIFRDRPCNVEKFSMDNWIKIMKRYLDKTCAQASKLDRAWTVIEFLEQEASGFGINTPELERDTGQEELEILARRFGTGPVDTTYSSNFLPETKNGMKITCFIWML